MSFFRPSYRPPTIPVGQAYVEPKPRAGGSYLWLVIGIVIIILAAVLTIILLLVRRARAKQNGTSTPPASCAAPPAPANVAATYDIPARTCVLTWSSVPKATRYRVYRKKEDPSVSKLNFEERIEVINLNYNFVNLEDGTHYFVVTAVNECGESVISVPAVFSPSCESSPPAPAAPNVTLSANKCFIAVPREEVEIDFPWETSFPGGAYIVNGNGQHGTAKNYVALVDRDGSPNGLVDVVFECGSTETKNYLTYIRNVQNTTVTVSDTENIGNSFLVKWAPIAGAEMYIVYAMGEDANGLKHHYGGYASGTDTSLTLATTAGDDIIEAKVRAFRICDLSELSEATDYTTN